MKTLILTSMCCALLQAEESQTPQYDTKSLAQQKAIDSADRQLYKQSNGNYALENGKRPFTKEALHEFLLKEKHKSCLVIHLPKGELPIDEVKQNAELSRLVKKFKTYGYKRIIILQTNGFSSRLIVHDTKD